MIEKPCFEMNSILFQIMISDGHSDIFVPTSELSSVIHLTHFYLNLNVPVLLLGQTGCGKSVAFSKVAKLKPF